MTTPTTGIERLARVADKFFCASDRAYGEPEACVRAILEALMPPTPEMIEAGEELFPCARGTESRAGQATPEAIFTAMLTTLLGEKEMMAERCATCRECFFWDRAGCTVEGGWSAGRCRRSGPDRDPLDGRYGPEGRGVWPLTSQNDWCGEWQLRPSQGNTL